MSSIRENEPPLRELMAEGHPPLRKVVIERDRDFAKLGASIFGQKMIVVWSLRRWYEET